MALTARCEQLLTQLTGLGSVPQPRVPMKASWLPRATAAEIEQLLEGLSGVPVQDLDKACLTELLRQLVHRLRRLREEESYRLPASSVATLTGLYKRLGAADVARGYVSQLLATSAGPEELAAFAELMAIDPPTDAATVMLGFSPLLQQPRYDPQALFPRLLDAVFHPTVAVAVMDLANFLKRRNLVEKHPAASRLEQLMQLLGGVVQRLGQIEEDPDRFAETRSELVRQIDDSVALAVSLCDALALIEDPRAIAKLYQAFEVHHRRLHIEAAAALARFDQEPGRESLIAMASDPVTRLRALAYADELGISERVDEQYRTHAARAESELALWLAQPAQVGLPPTRLELVDMRTQYWPGFDEPVECFLFRFDYHLGSAQYSNIGIAGPLTHALAADLQDLPPADLYAAFAGWHAQHDDIYEVDAEDLTPPQRVEAARLERRLRDHGLADVQPAMLGMFLGDRVLVARATREGHPGIAVVDHQDLTWLPLRNPERPLQPMEGICIYKGRRLLRSFNA